MATLEMTGIEPEEVIASRRWEQALFTTYTLSLTFFESTLLRRLRESGCRDIWIIADVEGYRSSLMERRSSRIGQEYRLLPAGLPHGVFHPKCCYLAGPDGDLLLVGSGNLTFGGHGRNLEVLEVLEPASAARTFEDFAGFLEALQSREDLLIPERAWATTFAARARATAAAFPPTPVLEQPRLIHTVNRPAVEQLGEVCAANGGGKQLFVLSPFHDLDGAATRLLAEKTGCKDISVGLSCREGDPSPFPFMRAKGWNKTLRAVRPELADEGRSLHAKWIEVELPEARLTVTGSINATSPALCSTKNVEVGVLRMEPLRSSHVRWKSVTMPTDFVAPKRRPSGMGHTCLVHASILGDGALVGKLLSLLDPSGDWTGRIVLPSGSHSEVHVTVSSTGDFRTTLANAERLAFKSSLQIELMKGDRVARGWIHMDELLRMPRLQGLGVTSLLRLINREETEDDAIALLEYFAMSSARHLSTFTRPIKVTPQGSSEAESDEEPQVLIELEALAPTPELPDRSENDSAESPVGGEGAVLERVMAQLRRRLISQPLSRGGLAVERPISALVSEEGEDEGEGDSGATIQQRLKSLELFDEQMRLVSSTADSPTDRSATLVVWFEVGMDMRLSRLKDRDLAAEFLRTWLHAACAEPRSRPQVDALEQHVFTSAALVPLLSAQDVDLPALRSRLHGLLERFAGGDVKLERARSSLLVNRRVGFAGRMLDTPTAELKSSLELILATRTRRRQLQDVLAAYDARRPPDRTLPIFSKGEPCGPQLLACLSRWGPRPNLREQRTQDACAHCFVTLSPSAQLELLTYRVTQCLQCQRLTVQLKP
ncbi:hypothetical protein JRI60_35975 [Archangium violaceum]|uniref:hypothetical protein n=1 Tax=Archangium violaceum TaxID=83451 RepID=UPI00194FD140|nr:hypothetical protein [Archangium violaceum]QRN94492.1 hypothetical protein JRI60_35975 [Archangium violaceum]